MFVRGQIDESSRRLPCIYISVSWKRCRAVSRLPTGNLTLHLILQDPRRFMARSTISWCGVDATPTLDGRTAGSLRSPASLTVSCKVSYEELHSTVYELPTGNLTLHLILRDRRNSSKMADRPQTSRNVHSW
ncbi:hypothetical protein PsYK624_170870 [Phanerochaete sordida]|uniref:Uncharacterized protein n=1 Tax=Phanerochaete sordida TaxID=48140 RepID=A0A9P3GYW2_9APHY|nr:hypothetical protein PsYK624_170870 [Phanerochaete sordida]